ncbi:hypothetical protein N9L02_03095 [Gammaproteobacteria bacterium]|nr:hypothetical protein [Gammaproteobacteria bacterium]
MIEVKELVVKYIGQLCEENGKTIPKIENESSIMDDIGLSSIEFATLISFLETDLNVDPFIDGSIAVTDIRTVGEICNVYKKAIEKNKI